MRMIGFNLWMRLHRILPNFNPDVSRVATANARRSERGSRPILSYLCWPLHKGLWLFFAFVHILLARKLVEDWLVVIQQILVAGCQPLYYFCQHTLPCRVNQTGNNFISDILSWSPEHFFQLSGREPLNDNILLFLLMLVFLFEFNNANMSQCSWRAFLIGSISDLIG